MSAAGSNYRVRWRWGACPRCGADAWIDTEDQLNVACSKECRGFSIWDYLEAEYRWQQEFGALFGLRSFDAAGRPTDVERRTR
ncbi:MAG: hypothetical protein ACHP93_05220 [Solirubrobacterales bacterium]